MDCLTGIHAVKEALRRTADRPDCHCEGAAGYTRRREIVQLARKQGVRCGLKNAGQLDRWRIERSPGRVALAASRAAGTLEDILKMRMRVAATRLIILLDGVEDPHNLAR